MRFVIICTLATLSVLLFLSGDFAVHEVKLEEITSSEIDAISQLERADVARVTDRAGSQNVDQIRSTLQHLEHSESRNDKREETATAGLKKYQDKLHQLIHESEQAVGSLEQNTVLADHERARLQKAEAEEKSVLQSEQSVQKRGSTGPISKRGSKLARVISKVTKHMLADPAPAAAAAPAAEVQAVSAPASDAPAPPAVVVASAPHAHPSKEEDEDGPVFLFHGFWLIVFAACLLLGGSMTIWFVSKT